MSSFKKIGYSVLEKKFPLTLYESEFSGCKVVIVDHPSPVVYAVISIVGTLSENDFDLAHSLEHMVFEGSKKYPHTQFLQKLAAKCHGSTAATTYTDNTGYRITTVGSQGFITVLPVYLDHIMNPLLTESFYKTEVHHVNGAGLDGGVVFSEKQTIDYSVDRELNKLVYGADSPFSRRGGGRWECVRENSTLEKIKLYHQKYYKMENMIVTVVGTVPHEDMLLAVATFERDNHFAKTECPIECRKLGPCVGVDMKPLKPSVKRARIFSKENTGTVRIRWQGPQVSDLEWYSVNHLMLYFSTLLQSYYQGLTPALCSKIEGRIKCFQTTVFGFDFENVNPEYLHENQEYLFHKSLLEVIHSHKLDLDRLRRSLMQTIDGILQKSSPSTLFESVRRKTVRYHMYGRRIHGKTEPLELFLSDLELYQKMLDFDLEYWTKLRGKYFTVDFAALYLLPDASTGWEEAENEFIKQRINKMGEEGLKKCAADLEEAIQLNKLRAAPDHLLDQFTVAPITSFPDKCSVIAYTKILNFGKCNVRETEVNFIQLVFDGQSIPQIYRPLLNLLFGLLGKGGASSPSNIIYSLKCTVNGNKIQFEIKPDPQKVEDIPHWMNWLFNEMHFEKPAILKVLNQLANSKPNDHEIISLMASHLVDIPGTAEYYSNQHRNRNFHKMLLDNMADASFSKNLVRKLTILKKLIQKCRVNVKLNGSNNFLYRMPINGWPAFNSTSTVFVRQIFEGQNYLRSAGRTYCMTVPNPVYPSSTLKQFVAAPLDFKNMIYSQLLNQYFNDITGPMQFAVRNSGTAYWAYLSSCQNLGISLTIYRASNLIGAYQEAKRAVFEVINSHQLDPVFFEIVKKSTIQCLFQRSTEPNGKFNDYGTNFQLLTSATSKAVLEAVGKYYLDLFDEAKNCKVIVVPASFQEAVKKEFPNVEFKNREDFYVDIPVNIKRMCNRETGIFTSTAKLVYGIISFTTRIFIPRLMDQWIDRKLRFLQSSRQFIFAKFRQWFFGQIYSLDNNL